MPLGVVVRFSMLPARARLVPLVILAVAALAVAAAPAHPRLATGNPPAGAVTPVVTLDDNPQSFYNGGNWANPDVRHVHADASGRIVVVSVDGAQQEVVAETFDPATFARVDEHRVSYDGWPEWGGYYHAPNGENFVLVGRNNPGEDPGRDVVAVRRYTADWSPAGTAFLKGGASQGIVGIYEPFRAGAADMVQVGQRLVVHLPRLMFEASDGLHHQSSLTFEVDLGTMATRTFESLGSYPYSSHSFAQALTLVGDDLAILDHGDAYPRAVQVSVVRGYAQGQRDVEAHEVFGLRGAIGDNYTGVAVTGMAAGSSRAVVVGHAVPHDEPVDGVTGWNGLARNVFLVSVDTTTGDRDFTWITRLDPRGDAFADEPRIVRVGADRFVMLFTVQEASRKRLEYRLVDASGGVLASRTWTGKRFDSISDPALVGDTVYWVGLGSEAQSGTYRATAYLSGVNVSDPTAPQLLVGDFSGSDARLRSMTVSGGVLRPGFKRNRMLYQVTAKAGARKVRITTAPLSPAASLRIRVGTGAWKSTTTATVKVKARQNTVVRIAVTSADRSKKLTYLVSVDPRH